MKWKLNPQQGKAYISEEVNFQLFIVIISYFTLRLKIRIILNAKSKIDQKGEKSEILFFLSILKIKLREIVFVIYLINYNLIKTDLNKLKLMNSYV